MSKILFYDIETSPNVVYSWTTGNKVRLTHDNILKERQIICIAWKWEDGKKVYSADWGSDQDDRRVLKAFLPVIQEADVIIAHNGDRYDLRFMQGRLAYHNLPPIAPATIDTLKQSRKAFFTNSHKLDYLGQFLGLGRKLDTGGFGLWKDVMSGSGPALKKMVRYCRQDVRLLESVYHKIKIYAPQTIHIGLLKGGDHSCCKACGSPQTRLSGTRIMSTIRYQCRRCASCGHYWRTNERVAA